MSVTTVEKETTERPSRLREFWFYFRENRGAVIGLWIFAAFAFCAAFAPFLSPYDPTEQFRQHTLQPPFWQEGGNWTFPLGTDPLGRDMLSRLTRILYGGRMSLWIGAAAVLLSMVTGIPLGLISGYSGGIIDTIIMRIMDVILAFPSLLLALVLVAILGPSLTNAMIAIAIPVFPELASIRILSFVSLPDLSASSII